MYNKYFLPAAWHVDCKMNISRENTAADDDGHIESNPEGIYINHHNKILFSNNNFFFFFEFFWRVKTNYLNHK
jgi:hypothetical protein